ncbi:MAG: hypothetical protein VXZ77_01710 [Pseudomonadota bacterium]|nr:hypothetical protein [Pseudomonadota bacterium]
MELKRLIANDSKSALQSVRDECGDDALIVSTNKVGKKTEVIYAIDESVKNSEEGFHKTQADAARFSDALGEIKQRQNNESTDVRSLLGQIQRELGALKQKIDSQQLGFQIPEINAPSKASHLAIRSLKNRIEKLMETPLEEQKSWSGIQLFAGTDMSGKNACVARLTANRKEALDAAKPGSYAIINLNAKKKSNRAFLQQWQQLGELAGSNDVPIFHINNVNDLRSLIESFASKHNLLVDLNNTALLGDTKMAETIKKYGIEVNYCLAANAPAPIFIELSRVQDQVPSMSCVCSVNEQDEINQLIGRLAANNLQISAINKVSDLELI